MKKIILVFAFILLAMPLFAQVGYWYKTEFIELSPKNDSVYYLSFRDKSANNKQKISEKGECINIMAQFNDYQFLVKKPSNLDIKDCYFSPKYEAKAIGGEMVILPQLIMSVKNKEVLSSILNRYKNILSVYNSFRSIYELDCDLFSSDDVLRLSMEINKIDGVNWCEPNKMLNIVSCNTYYPYQFYLNNPLGEDINVVNAWNITNGNPDITVAVIDCGVDMGHEDLSANIINGYTVDHPSGLGSILNQNHSHGTACAGIIGAINNSIGVRGIASGVKILPVNISTGESNYDGLPILASEAKIATAIRWAVDNGADVLSCSWGGPSPSVNIDSAIVYARTEGRNMKGAVVVCSSGNNYSSLTNVMYPARFDGVLAVGAIDRDGEICHYSQRGSSLNLVAPSNKYLDTGEIYTTYNTGKGDIGNYNYTSMFGGTSAACPQVAGVAALVLSVNPLLTEGQVRSVLQETAKDLGDIGFDTTYGYGLIDAYAAVKASELYISGDLVPCLYSIYKVENLPNTYSVTWSLSSSSGFSITQNLPQANQCEITNLLPLDYSEANLIAHIWKNGQEVETLTKHIQSEITTGIYSQIGTTYQGITYPNIPETEFPNGSIICVNPKCVVQVSAPYFENMTFNHTGASPSFWGCNFGEITMKFPYSSSIQTMYVYGVDGCRTFNFTVRVYPQDVPIILDVIGNGNGYDITLNYQGDRGNRDQNQGEQAFEWDIDIRNAETGYIVYEGHVIGKTISVNTTGWPSGVYIVHAKFNDQETYCKILVK